MKGFKIRLSRTFLLIIGGVTILGGGSGVAAVFIGADKLLGPSYSSINGLECTTVETVKIKKADRYWIRKYVTADGQADGISRLKTALRVARKVQQTEQPDLVQVTVLDPAGPTERSRMRGRAIGAQVVYIPDLAKAPEGTAVQSINAYYVDGKPDESGDFWGLRIDLPLEDAEHLSAKLTDDADCLDAALGETDGHGPSGGHGAEAGHGDAKDHGKAASKAKDQGDGHDGGHGGEPAAGGDGAPSPHGEDVPVAGHEGEEKPGLLASLMGMVGLGGEAPAADAHEAGVSSEHEPTADAHLEPGAAHDAAHTGEPDQHSALVPHAAKSENGEAGSAPPEPGWLDTIKGAVGLGASEDGAEATAEPAADTGAAEHPNRSEPAHAAATESHAPAAEEKANDHGAAWLAKMRAQPLTAEGQSEAKAEDGGHAASTDQADDEKKHTGVGEAHHSGEATGHKAAEAHAKAVPAPVVAEEDDPEQHRRKPDASKVTQ